MDDLDIDLWRAITKLYVSDPLTHCYLMYDLIYEYGNIDAVFSVDYNGIVSYILIWNGYRVQGVHLWGYDIDLLNMVDIARDKPVYIHLYTDDYSFSRKIIDIVNQNAKILEFYDMVVDEKSFIQYNNPIVHRLSLDDIEAFIAIKRIQGREIGYEEAQRILLRGRYYGVYIDRMIVAIAGRYIALPEVWVIGDVYVHPDYRGRGYGKAVTSAITRDAVASGAIAMLHVDTENIPAINLYKGLGYRVYRKRIWIYIA
ncbi:GCN5-related N-acetyltransferase [Ignisphaera aggregans DSM 17230]|uniref:GCN5-related N-acetyltransferase n=1 Tax=Ignisphaera aggregans (strain DSM 17230 / JCM 13409 / AQ1.S1) TaxID=583356 RepID=E0SSS7_IGNAA|nr:GCN5-related N-acetyltransferase [Ignisphaera aggregans DSM 17230]